MTFVIFLVMTRLSLIWKAYKVNVNKFYKQARIEKFKYIFYYEIVVCFFSFFFFLFRTKVGTRRKNPKLLQNRKLKQKMQIVLMKAKSFACTKQCNPQAIFLVSIYFLWWKYMVFEVLRSPIFFKVLLNLIDQEQSRPRRKISEKLLLMSSYFALILSINKLKSKTNIWVEIIKGNILL